MKWPNPVPLKNIEVQQVDFTEQRPSETTSCLSFPTTLLRPTYTCARTMLFEGIKQHTIPSRRIEMHVERMSRVGLDVSFEDLCGMDATAGSPVAWQSKLQNDESESMAH